MQANLLGSKDTRREK